MVVRIMEVTLHASWVHSLKEKRVIVKSLTGKLRNRFNISVIEADRQDVHQEIVIGIAFVSGSQALSDSITSKVIDFIAENCEANIIEVVEDVV